MQTRNRGIYEVIMSLDTIADKKQGLLQGNNVIGPIADKKQRHLQSNNVIGHNSRQETEAFTK